MQKPREGPRLFPAWGCDEEPQLSFRQCQRRQTSELGVSPHRQIMGLLPPQWQWRLHGKPDLSPQPSINELYPSDDNRTWVGSLDFYLAVRKQHPLLPRHARGCQCKSAKAEALNNIHCLILLKCACFYIKKKKKKYSSCQEPGGSQTLQKRKRKENQQFWIQDELLRVLK